MLLHVAGQPVCSRVYGVDSSGKKSEAAVTDGFIVDITPPVLNNHIVIDDHLVRVTFESDAAQNWEAVEDSTVELWDGAAADAKEGAVFATVTGTVKAVSFQHFMCTYGGGNKFTSLLNSALLARLEKDTEFRCTRVAQQDRDTAIWRDPSAIQVPSNHR